MEFRYDIPGARCDYRAPACDNHNLARLLDQPSEKKYVFLEMKLFYVFSGKRDDILQQ